MNYAGHIHMCSNQLFDLYHFRDGNQVSIQRDITSETLFNYLKPSNKEADNILLLTIGEGHTYQISDSIVSADYFTIIPVSLIKSS